MPLSESTPQIKEKAEGIDINKIPDEYTQLLEAFNITWPGNFDVNFDEAKKAVSDPYTNYSNFGPLSLDFCNKILARIMTNTLMPQKGFLNNVTCRDVFVLYCLIKKYKINWSA
ncbi:hypothetical protein FXO38_25818 [Capsicum annuum]|nr:hypothetical protein FXO38_25818 [Capsicum annuum]